MVAGAAGSTRLVDTKGLVRLERYYGEKEKFQAWKWELYVAVRAMDPPLASMLKHVENNFNVEFGLNRLNEDERKKASDVFTILALLCKGEAAQFIMNSEEGNGFMAWRDLCRAKMIRSSTALIKKLMEPEFKSADPRVNLKTWQKEAQSYFDKTGETVPEAIRRTVYVNKVSPLELRQHLIMNQSRLLTSADIEDEIMEYCDAMEDYGQARTGLVAAAQPAEYGDQDCWDDWSQHWDQPLVVAPVGKGDRKGDKKGDRKGDGKGKGKLHKGLGKNPDRAEWRKFGGMCNWCWRVGHKESACWFKQEYERTNGKPHAAAASGAAGGDSAAEMPSADIRSYFSKRPREQQQAQGMDVGALTGRAFQS
jgi:hypothetical protein